MYKSIKKEQIIQCAIEIFCDNGYERTTISGVAKQAGIGKGTVYEYFKSKDELFTACVKSMLAYYNKGFAEIIHKDITFREKLREYLVHTGELFMRASVGISLMQKQPNGDMVFLHNIFEEERIYLQDELSVAIQKAIDNGEIRSDLQVEAITFYIQMLVFRLFHENIDTSNDENIINDILTLIYSGIGNASNKN